MCNFCRVSAILLLFVSQSLMASDKLLQLIEYIGADYHNAVTVKGTIASVAEYQEMLEFAALIRQEGEFYDNEEFNQQALTLEKLNVY